MSTFLPAERTYLATVPRLTLEVVEELLEYFMDPVHGSNAKGRKTLVCVVCMLMICSLLARQNSWRSLRNVKIKLQDRTCRCE